MEAFPSCLNRSPAVCTDHSFFLRLSADGLWGCFHTSTCVNIAVVNAWVPLSEIRISLLLDEYPDVDGESDGSSLFGFLRDPILFSTAAALIYIPIHRAQRLCFGDNPQYQELEWWSWSRAKASGLSLDLSWSWRCRGVMKAEGHHTHR